MSIVFDLDPNGVADQTSVATITTSGAGLTVGSALVTRSGAHVTTSDRGHRSDNAAFGDVGTNQTLASADYRVRAFVRFIASETNAAMRVWARSADASTGYQLLWFGSTLSIRRVSGGTGNNLTGGTATFPIGNANAGQDYELMIECIGTAIKGYVDGVERVSGVDSNITAANAAGWRTEGNGSTGTAVRSAGWHISRYQVELVGAPSASNAPRSQFYHHMGMR